MDGGGGGTYTSAFFGFIFEVEVALAIVEHEILHEALAFLRRCRCATLQRCSRSKDSTLSPSPHAQHTPATHTRTPATHTLCTDSGGTVLRADAGSVGPYVSQQYTWLLLFTATHMPHRACIGPHHRPPLSVNRAVATHMPHRACVSPLALSPTVLTHG